MLTLVASLCHGGEPPKLVSTTSQELTIVPDPTGRKLTLSTPYYSITHDLQKGGVISEIRLAYGKKTNLLRQPVGLNIGLEHGTILTDLNDRAPAVSHLRKEKTVVVTVEAKLLDRAGSTKTGSPGPIVRTTYDHRWGYVRIQRQLLRGEDLPVREVTPLYTVLHPDLSHYGYRDGKTEHEGVGPFSFGSNLWGHLRRGDPPAGMVRSVFVPRSMIFVDPGVEGLEWFAGSDLSQWDLQLAGKRGTGLCTFAPDDENEGLALRVSAYHSVSNSIRLPKRSVFEYYLSFPLPEGRALQPWLHTSFNRNRGDWVSAETIENWSNSGIQSIHCHNDGDYYEDGLFWRDGSYPPYPDMNRYDKVLETARSLGIATATYFSNKELHPATKEFKEHGQEWGRKSLKGNLQHNIFKGTNVFGVQMCLRSGWLPFLKSYIDRVLKNHPLDGVYYDWNVALHCYNPLHEGKQAGEPAAGHWDMDELLDLMEWTRERVGPKGLVIVHNTTTPMFVTENFSDFIVANEWGYGKWKQEGPTLEELPLEWSLAGARPRGVISYGQLDEKSPRRLHRVFALQAMLGGVSPWPANNDAFELASLLKPLGPIQGYRFADWRNEAVRVDGRRCGSTVYSRPGEAWIVLANMAEKAQEVRLRISPEKLPSPLSQVASATLERTFGDSTGTRESPVTLDAAQLSRDGVPLKLPGTAAVLLRLRE